MLWEEVERFRELSGEDPEKTSIARIGGFLDGYEKGKACTQACTESQRESAQEDIIKCKECKHKHYCLLKRSKNIEDCDDDDFCSCGKREES